MDVSDKDEAQPDDGSSDNRIHDMALKDELSLDLTDQTSGNVDTPQLNSSVSDPKSGISLLDCDDILNFDFEDLNDLDSFIDKHVKETKTEPQVKVKHTSGESSKNEQREKSKVEKVQLKRPSTPNKEEPKEQKVAKIVDDGSTKSEVKSSDVGFKLSGKQVAVIEEKELKKTTSASKPSKIIYSARTSPNRLSESKQLLIESKNEMLPPTKQLTKKAISKQDAEKFEELNRELDELKSSSKTSKERKRLRRKRAKSIDEEFESENERKSKKNRKVDSSRKSKNAYKYEKRRSGSHEKKHKRKKQRRSSSSSEFTDASLSDNDDVTEDGETLTSSSEISSAEREPKRASKRSRKRKQDHKVKKKSSKKDKAPKHEPKHKPIPVSKARKIRIEVRTDSDQNVDSGDQVDAAPGHFNDFETYAGGLDDVSDSDPYAHLKPSKVADNDASSDDEAAPVKFRESVEDDDIDFDEDDDIFKIAPIESNLSEPEGSGEKKKKSLLEELKKKHRTQVTYSDDDVTNEDEEIESLIRAPQFTLEKTTATLSDKSSFLGRRVLIGEKESKEKNVKKKGTLKPFKVDLKQIESDPERSTSGKVSLRGVKERLTLRATGLQRSFGGSTNSEAAAAFSGSQPRSSVHSRLGEKPRGNNSSSNNNTALSRFL